MWLNDTQEKTTVIHFPDARSLITKSTFLFAFHCVIPGKAQTRVERIKSLTTPDIVWSKVEQRPLLFELEHSTELLVCSFWQVDPDLATQSAAVNCDGKVGGNVI